MICAVIGLYADAARAQSENSKGLSPEQVDKGEYLVRITGCNDCHTPGYGESEGKLPMSAWLTGSPVGYKGGWGTSYPPNLRHLIATTSERDWVHKAKTLKTAPPMPWFNLNAMSESDLRAIYAFIKSLGDSSFDVPRDLPPGETPKGPYIDFDVKNQPGPQR
jgi:mono/diheme cytochrome c family protein